MPEKFEPRLRPKIENKESKEEKEIKLEDFFGYGIDEIKKDIERNEEIALGNRQVMLSTLFEIKRKMKDFPNKYPAEFKDFLEKIKNWESGILVKELQKELKFSSSEISKAVIKYQLFSEMAKFYEIKPSKEMKDLINKTISLNGFFGSYELEKLNNLNPDKEEIKLTEEMIEIQPTLLQIGWSWTEFIEDARKKELNDEEEKLLHIFSNKEEFEEIKRNSKKIKEKFKQFGIHLECTWDDLETCKNENVGRILSQIEDIKEIINIFDSERMITLDSVEEFINISLEDKKKIFSEDFRKKIKDFKIEIQFLDLKNILEFLNENKENISKNGDKIKEIISDFDIKKINKWDFKKILDFSEKEIKEIHQRDFRNFSFISLEPLIENSSINKKISLQLLENIKKTKGDYQARNFPADLLKYISSSLTLFYFTFTNPNREILERLKEKISNSDTHKKIYNKSLSGVLELNDIILGRKLTKKIIEKDNIDYLTAAQKIKIPFDFYGVLWEDLEGIKREINKRAGELIDDYSQNKGRYLPYIDSLIGYAAEYKKEVNDVLKIKDLWNFKFSHIDDLGSILEEVKNFKMSVRKKEGKHENIEIYIQNMKEHLRLEEFSSARERVSLLDKKNRGKALTLIEKMEGIIKLLEQEKIPEQRDLDILLSNKAIFRHLKLPLSLESIREAIRVISKGEERKGDIEDELKSVEIIKKPEEYLGAIDIEPSCMRVNGDLNHGALTISQSPILILGVKDNYEKIRGRALLIPIKDKKGKWRFELKNTYGLGEEYIKDFIKEMENILREKWKNYYGEEKDIMTEEIINGELPKTKKISSTSELKFYRDGKGDIELTELEKNE